MRDFVTRDVGHGNALPSPLSTVHVTGSARGLAVTFHPPLPAAGAEPAVADTPDAVAAGSAVLDTDDSSTDRDRVEHENKYPALGIEDATGDPWVAARLYEAERQARLRRWQAIG